jgi:sterol desaturase/sphingolipid hydroxylase (fatty acid hydroxylase superfamily)
LTALAIFGSLLGVALWELLAPRRRREFPALRRRLGNIGFWVANLLIVGVLLPASAAMRVWLEVRAGVRLPSWPIADGAASLIVGFLLLDLLRYVVHRCEHTVPLFWRFHALHHSDPDVDVTTSVRHHPVEYLFASAFYWTVSVVFGVPVMVLAAHGLAVFATAAIQHGNIRLPQAIDRPLQFVLVTPDLHRVHHSEAPAHANANFGAVLSVWDRLFGTLKRLSRQQQEAIAFGVRELSRSDALKPSVMALTPWRIARAARA